MSDVSARSGAGRVAVAVLLGIALAWTLSVAVFVLRIGDPAAIIAVLSGEEQKLSLWDRVLPHWFGVLAFPSSVAFAASFAGSLLVRTIDRRRRRAVFLLPFIGALAGPDSLILLMVGDATWILVMVAVSLLGAGLAQVAWPEPSGAAPRGS